MDGMSTGGLSSEEEQTNHINCLEILACFFTLKTFYHSLRNCHIGQCLTIQLQFPTLITWVEELFHAIGSQEICGCGVLKETCGLLQPTFQENLMS